jgi:hypothetical protein
VSRAKFAPITSALLARKGDARPWQPEASAIAKLATAPFAVGSTDDMPPAVENVSPQHTQLNLLKVTFESPEFSSGAERAKRCTVKLSSAEYERLGIIAVKKNTTRQQILRRAVEQYFELAQREYEKDCECLGGHACHHDGWPSPCSQGDAAPPHAAQ